jgi:hypothetical protein
LDITTILLSRGSNYEKLYCDKNKFEFDKDMKILIDEIQEETTNTFLKSYNPKLDLTGKLNFFFFFIFHFLSAAHLATRNLNKDMLKRVFNWMEKKENFLEMLDNKLKDPSLLHLSCLPSQYYKTDTNNHIDIIRFLNKKGINDFNKKW